MPPPPLEAMQGCPLPPELVLEIVARSDAATLVRCAASCKPLRREILRPAFIRRVCHGPGAVVPPCLVGFLNHKKITPSEPPPFILVHPATPAAASLSENHIAPFICRRIADADNQLARRGFQPLTSRHGLVLLLVGTDRFPVLNLCVYDPMGITKYRFLPAPPPPDISYLLYDYKFVLLTAADGVTSCSFLLLAFDFYVLQNNSRSVTVRTFSSSDSGAWSPGTLISQSPPDLHGFATSSGAAAVVCGGSIYWLLHGIRSGYYIFTYNVLTRKGGWIQLPSEVPADDSRKLHLVSWPSRRLSLLAVAEAEHKVTVWLLLSGASGAAAGWERHAVIDTATTVPRELPYHVAISGDMSGVVLLLRYQFFARPEGFIFLDLDTKQMHAVNNNMPLALYEVDNKRALLYEIDLVSRLSGMKTFL